MQGAEAERGRRDGVMLVLTMLAAPLAWTAHLLASYLLVTIGCATGWQGTRTSIVLLTVFLAGAASYAGLAGYRRWRRLREPDAWTGVSEQRMSVTALLLRLGLIMTGLFTLAILLGGLGALLVPLCAMGSHH